jgi:hypothetical protein
MDEIGMEHNEWEYHEQVKLFQMRDLYLSKYPDLKYLNSSLCGIRLSIGLAVKAKRMGMPKGFPDINLPTKRSNFSGLYIELKRPAIKSLGVKAGTLKKEQKEWIAYLGSQGYFVDVCRGAENALNIILGYLDQ